MVKVSDLIITTLDTITNYSLTGEYLFTLDELQDATISNSEEKSDVTGKQGRKLSSIKKNKAVTIKGTNGVLSAGLLQTQVGSEFSDTGAVPVEFIDYLTVKSNAATTTHKAVGTAGAEISAVYVIGDNNITTSKLTQATAAASGKFAYAAATKALTFNGLADGTNIAVCYTYHANGNKLVNMSDNYSEKVRMIIDCTAEDKCGNIYHVQIKGHKADFNGNFELGFGGDQVVQAFEAEFLAGSCGAGGALWDYIVFDDTEVASA